MSSMIMGVDPGGASTGIVVRDGIRLVDACTVHRTGGLPRNAKLTDPEYLVAVRLGLEEMFDSTHDGFDAVAVEGLNSPSPHIRVTNPGAVMAAAIVLGYVVCWAEAHVRHVVIVPPGKHGAIPYAGAYPGQLLDRGDRVAQGGQRRHERAAWDVAGEGAERLRRAQVLGGGQA